MKVLINASNLHSGGGVAVAVSFFSELSLKPGLCSSIDVAISSAVLKNLNLLGIDLSVFKTVYTCNAKGMFMILKKFPFELNDYELVFTVFGPFYRISKPKCHLVGMAQPSIVYPDNLYLKSLSFPTKLVLKLKRKIQEFFFCRADCLVVEASHIKDALEQRPKFSNIKFEVVENEVNPLFEDASRWAAVKLPDGGDKIKLGVVSRNYPHKNLEILPNVKKILSNKYNIDVDIYVTLRDDEWSNCSSIFKRSMINIGELSVAQVPSFLYELDAVIFPSLLECYSATPIEALAMRKPLFASDLDFIKNPTMGAAIYFNPQEADDIAVKIYRYFCVWSESQRNDLKNSGKRVLAQKACKSGSRAECYIDLMNFYSS